MTAEIKSCITMKVTESLYFGDPVHRFVRRFLQVFRGEAGMLGNPRQHFRSDLFTFMKCKNVIRPARTSKNTVGSPRLPFDGPTNAKQGSQDLMGSG